MPSLSWPVVGVCEPDIKVTSKVPVIATQYIRRMRGGAQSHLLKCADGEYYVSKFMGNPQGNRILANEFLCTNLGRRLRLPFPEQQIILLKDSLIKLSEEMYFETPTGRTPIKHGLCFGSCYPAGWSVEDISWPRLKGNDLGNPRDFAGSLLFDIWTANTDSRQFIYYRPNSKFQKFMYMIDSGNCFDGVKWRFVDLPIMTMHQHTDVYDWITGIDSFEPWLSDLETMITQDVIEEDASAIPTEWYDNDQQALSRLIETLDKRRKLVRAQIIELQRDFPRLFRSWGALPHIHC